jgi:GntR family transcriptional regulator, rspAB operon transcriptional repressor
MTPHPPRSKQSRDRSQRGAHLVFEQLRGEILSLKLPPGTTLSRSELQRQFGLSSTPVRDALMKLEEIGLVDVFPQSRTTVSLIDVKLAREAQFLRRSIELEVVYTLASNPNAEVIRELRASIAELRDYGKRGDLERFNDADLKFHNIMYAAADAAELWELVRRQSVHIDRIRRLHLPISGKAAQIEHDHSEIVKTIAKGDPSRAQLLLRDHLSQSLAFSEELRSRIPGYFRQKEPSEAR